MGFILTFIVSSIVPIAWLLLRGLGAGVVTYYGLDLLVDYLGEKLQENFDGMPVAMFQMMSLMGIPQAINTALSFITTVDGYQRHHLLQRQTQKIHFLLERIWRHFLIFSRQCSRQ